MKKLNTILLCRLLGASVFLFVSCKQTKMPEKKGDPHSFSNPDDFKLSHLALHLNADFTHHTLQGYAELDIEKMQSNDTLRLDTRDLHIQQVVVNNRDTIPFSLGQPDNLLGSCLSIPILYKNASVRIYYETSPHAAALQWLEIPGRSPFLFSQSQAILARSWVPCQDVPGVKFTYEANIQVPAHLMALMSAENPQTKSPDGKYHFVMKQPISSYLLALTIGNFEYKPLNARCGIYAEPDIIQQAYTEFTDLPRMMDAAEQLYGPYRWGRYDVAVLPPSFPFGGMENPRLTFATPTIIAGDRSLVALLAHELAHSWSGNLVTNASWNDFWLNEGFTMYFENRIMEQMYGKSYADMLEYLGYDEMKEELHAIGDSSVDTHLFLDLKGKDPDEAVNAVAYEKGRFFLRTIEEAVGRKDWDAFVNTYFNTYAFQSMDTKHFLEILQSELLKNHPGAAEKIQIHDWVYGPGIPKNCPQVQSTLFDSVDAVKTNWLEGKISTKNIPGKQWNTHQWLHFLRGLHSHVNAQQLSQLDAVFHLTQTGNCEIACDWFLLTLPAAYSAADAACDAFLVKVGRRKFLTPIYSAMLKTPGGKDRAKRIFKLAEPNYHPLAKHTIGQLLENGQAD